jgi:hypothetical protein
MRVVSEVSRVSVDPRAFLPCGRTRMHAREEQMKHSAPLRSALKSQGIGGCRVEQPRLRKDLPVPLSVWWVLRYRLGMKATIAVLALVAATMIGSAGFASAAPTDCAVRFPEAEWTTLREGPVSVEATGMTPELSGRFNDEIAIAHGWIADEIGPFSTTVCLVAGESNFDAARFESGSRRLHAYSDLPERLFVLNTERFGFVAPASAFALSQHALWQNNGDQPFPEPIAGAIGHWYRARILDRLEQYHRDVMFGNLFDTEASIDWTSSSQKPVQSWDPETNFAPIGDFVDFAVATYGTDVLLETSGARWAEIEGQWRVGLRNDLRGRDTDTTGWIGGVAITAMSILIALVAITIGLVAKYRKKERLPTPSPIPGFFSETVDRRP